MRQNSPGSFPVTFLPLYPQQKASSQNETIASNHKKKVVSNSAKDDPSLETQNSSISSNSKLIYIKKKSRKAHSMG